MWNDPINRGILLHLLHIQKFSCEVTLGSCLVIFDFSPSFDLHLCSISKSSGVVQFDQGKHRVYFGLDDIVVS